jgi:exopolysaccharide biosynthesis polyprenyl glycosylphosphotransferase
MAHALRALARVTGLLIADVVAMAVTMELLSRSGQLTLGFGLDHVLHLDTWVAISRFETIAAICAGLFLAGSYGGGDARRDGNRQASGTALGLLIALWQSLWSNFAFMIGSVLAGTVALISAVVLVRWSANALFMWLRPAAFKPTRTLLIGSEAEVARFSSSMLTDEGVAFPSVAHLDPSRGRRTAKLPANCYGIDDLPEAIAEHDVDTIILCGQLEDLTLSHLMRFAEAAGCRVLSPSRAFALANLTPSVDWQDGVPMIQLTRPGLHGRDLVLKRLLDLTIGIVTLLAAAPVMVIVAILVRITSRGPIVFRQCRVGYAGSTFTILKFRTMYVDAEERVQSLQNGSLYADGKLFKMSADPRITPLGRWLRKLSLDELPQLLNVITGDMSLVGPRPPLQREVALYDDDEFIRFGMKPGITGPWQVSGRNRVTSFAEVLRIESAYLTRWTIWRDFGILAKTIPAVMRMDGAQ